MHGFRVGDWANAPTWTFNGNLDKPTFSPSLRVFDPASFDGTQFTKTACHLNLTDGQIIFHADSAHALAGQTVPMIDLEAAAEPVAGVPPATVPAADEPATPCPTCHGTRQRVTVGRSGTLTEACPDCAGT